MESLLIRGVFLIRGFRCGRGTESGGGRGIRMGIGVGVGKSRWGKAGNSWGLTRNQ